MYTKDKEGLAKLLEEVNETNFEATLITLKTDFEDLLLELYRELQLEGRDGDRRDGLSSYGYASRSQIISCMNYISDRFNCSFRIRWLLDLLKFAELELRPQFQSLFYYVILEESTSEALKAGDHISGEIKTLLPCFFFEDDAIAHANQLKNISKSCGSEDNFVARRILIRIAE